MAISRWHIKGDWFDTATAVFRVRVPLLSHPRRVTAKASSRGISARGITATFDWTD